MALMQNSEAYSGISIGSVINDGWVLSAAHPYRSYWPEGLLEAFSLRMAAHGFCVSSSMMMGDKRYALEQLDTAHCLADDGLRDLAMALFRHFEQLQSGNTRMN